MLAEPKQAAHKVVGKLLSHHWPGASRNIASGTQSVRKVAVAPLIRFQQEHSEPHTKWIVPEPRQPASAAEQSGRKVVLMLNASLIKSTKKVQSVSGRICSVHVHFEKIREITVRKIKAGGNYSAGKKNDYQHILERFCRKMWCKKEICKIRKWMVKSNKYDDG